MTTDDATVLVVDDLPQNLRLLDAVLSPHGFTVRCATSGEQALELLARELGRHYPPEHEVVVYEAVPFPTLPPVIVRVALAALSTAPVTVRSTLCVPPLPARPSDPEMRAALGMTPASGT